MAPTLAARAARHRCRRPSIAGRGSRSRCPAWRAPPRLRRHRGRPPDRLPDPRRRLAHARAPTTSAADGDVLRQRHASTAASAPPTAAWKATLRSRCRAPRRTARPSTSTSPSPRCATSRQPRRLRPAPPDRRRRRHAADRRATPTASVEDDALSRSASRPASRSSTSPACAIASPASTSTIDMQGEVFEMEDQRNWTDASFKTYCRPLVPPPPFPARRRRDRPPVLAHRAFRQRPAPARRRRCRHRSPHAARSCSPTSPPSPAGPRRTASPDSASPGVILRVDARAPDVTGTIPAPLTLEIVADTARGHRRGRRGLRRAPACARAGSSPCRAPISRATSPKARGPSAASDGPPPCRPRRLPGCGGRRRRPHQLHRVQPLPARPGGDRLRHLRDDGHRPRRRRPLGARDPRGLRRRLRQRPQRSPAAGRSTSASSRSACAPTRTAAPRRRTRTAVRLAMAMDDPRQRTRFAGAFAIGAAAEVARGGVASFAPAMTAGPLGVGEAGTPLFEAVAALAAIAGETVRIEGGPGGLLVIRGSGRTLAANLGPIRRHVRRQGTCVDGLRPVTWRGALIGCGFFARNHMHGWADAPGRADRRRLRHRPGQGRRLRARLRRRALHRRRRDAGRRDARFRRRRHHRRHPPPAGRARPRPRRAHHLPEALRRDAMPTASPWSRPPTAPGRPLLVHENFRWQRAFRLLRAEIDAGSIGTPSFARLSFRHGFDVYANQPYLAEVEDFGLMDIGLHLFDLARFLMGDVASVACLTQRLNPRVRGEDAFTAPARPRQRRRDQRRVQLLRPHDARPLPGDPRPHRRPRRHARARPRLPHPASMRDGRVREIDGDPPVPAWGERPWHVVQDFGRRLRGACRRRARGHCRAAALRAAQPRDARDHPRLPTAPPPAARPSTSPPSSPEAAPDEPHRGRLLDRDAPSRWPRPPRRWRASNPPAPFSRSPARPRNSRHAPPPASTALEDLGPVAAPRSPAPDAPTSRTGRGASRSPGPSTTWGRRCPT